MLNTDLCNVEKASNSNTSIADCPAGFTYLASVKGCYSLVKENLEWGGAGLRCKSLHPEAHLVIINDAEEQLAVKTWMSSYTGMHIDLFYYSKAACCIGQMVKYAFVRVVYVYIG